MIQKFRDLLKVGENLEKVDNKLNVLHEETNFLKRNFDDIKESVGKIFDVMSETTRVQEKMLKAFTGDIKEISGIKEKFNEELFNFKLLKNHMQKEVMDKFQEEISKEIEQRKGEIRIDTGKYKEAKESVESFAKELGALKDEIAKFRDISSKVKSADFDLVKFTEKVKAIEDEKLQLMQKLDSTERLVAKMRRGQR